MYNKINNIIAQRAPTWATRFRTDIHTRSSHVIYRIKVRHVSGYATAIFGLVDAGWVPTGLILASQYE
jgi:hypothetical protein